MEPQAYTKATLVDLLDRVLDKGIVIHAELIVSVAGIPLIGVNLKAALAGMETMLDYGMMEEWDKSIRSQAMAKEMEKKKPLFLQEEILFEENASYYCDEGIVKSWRLGKIYLSAGQLVMYHPLFEEIMFELALGKIKEFEFIERHQDEQDHHQEVYILTHDNKIERFKIKSTQVFEKILKENLSIMKNNKGYLWEEQLA